jgi:hypothetical protein
LEQSTLPLRRPRQPRRQHHRLGAHPIPHPLRRPHPDYKSLQDFCSLRHHRPSRITSHVSRPRPITKRDIFHYVYAVLHHPAYREKYRLNLKRDFPRIPFYDDFWQWAAWGQQLMDLHLHYETIDPYPLQRTDLDPDETRKAYKPRLKADQKKGLIHLDTLTSLSGIPPLVWEYKLGNRSAVEWVLDRYKERKPRDPTIREKFNSYRFRDYKEDVIELIGRVTAVSLATMQIIEQMPAAVAVGRPGPHRPGYAGTAKRYVCGPGIGRAFFRHAVPGRNEGGNISY